jgi:EF hand
MKSKLIAIAIAAAFPLGAYAQMSNQPGQQQQRPGASDPTSPAPRGGSTTQGQGQPGTARLDMNRDGQISREEAKGSPELNARFNELDRNRDGVLSADEISNASSPQGSSGSSGSAPMKRQQ